MIYFNFKDLELNHNHNSGDKVPKHHIAGLKGGMFFAPKYEDEGEMRGNKEDWGGRDKAEVVREACNIEILLLC